MKIGVLTYHNTINFGASLQTYSMISALNALGGEAEVIDYRNNAIENRSGRLLPKKENLSARAYSVATVKHWGLRIKESSFKKFVDKHLKLSEETYNTAEELTQKELPYDFYLVGSDQVWNYNLNGEDSTYFLDFVKDRSRTATYASSFGLSSIPSNLRQFYIDGLNSINCISVRERMGARLVSELTGKVAQVHPDPVFLTSPEKWRELANSEKRETISNVFASYFLGPELRVKADAIIGDSVLSEMVEAKLAGGLSLRDLLSKKVSVRLDRGPVQFLQIMEKSTFVLTGSFHATAFAILLDKPFGVLLKGDSGKDARILELLETFSLENRVVDSAADLSFDAPSTQSDTRKIIDEMREDSLAYLESLING